MLPLKSDLVATVLLLTTEYGEHIIGGLGRHVTDLTIEGSKCGITYIVITVSQDNYESYTIENGIHVYRLLPWQKTSKDFLEYIRNINFRFTQFVLQELDYTFDLIHAHDWLMGIAANHIKKTLNLPLLSTIHATETGRKLGMIDTISKTIIEYESNLIRNSNHIIVCSLYMKNVLKNELSCQTNKIEVIPNGIIPSNYQSVLEREEAFKSFSFINSPFILAMGRLVKEKGFHLLIQAFSEIVDDYPDLYLVIAGVGPYQNELIQLAMDLHIENKIKFPGFVNEQERNTLLSRCEIVVVPSLYEPFGIISLEGMIAAKPVVSFNIGGLAEILAHNRGLIVNELSSKCLGEILQSYLLQPLKYNNMVMSGFEAASSQYNLSNLIYHTVELYRKITNKR
ncbi:glycosyltransferase family 4 protein [Metabacillus sediminilitoris]|uniref:Glycosyltransferase family 4 protein n=1 Tax=Metabacillus sediminilitoris TaxID=2567941 RepID=A0A4S4BZI3_9BACI|nr:glycosyltransferase [Metabacillus sediminilitoris]THF80613.1 glycosyltransferase family 4 protein [Metabacillus sediminilitoris]